MLHRADSFSGTFADAGTYSLIGAVAVLGGMARMTISLTVIMLEATGDVQYVLPLMVTLIAARWAGNAFNEGLYDIHIHLNGLPILEPACPEVAVVNDMCVREVMSDNVVKLHSIMTVGELYDTIVDTEHNIFPVERLHDGVLMPVCARVCACLYVLVGGYVYGGLKEACEEITTANFSIRV